MTKKIFIWLSVIFIVSAFALFFVFPKFFGTVSYQQGGQSQTAEAIGVKGGQDKEPAVVVLPPLNVADYDARMEHLANNPLPPPPQTRVEINPETGIEETIIIEPSPTPPSLWPARNASSIADAGEPAKSIYPNAGAILPFNRVIAYYGNLYSTRMGVLGQYPEEEMFEKLEAEVNKWEMADPNTPVVPALHYIAVVAQLHPGTDGKYRARMPSSEIEKVLVMAEKIAAIVFLDIQVGFSTVNVEIPLFEKYLKLPNVHLGIDPEFSMKGVARPGKAVGTVDAEDINFAVEYLAKVVRDNNLPPKILVIHRYTQKMVTNYQNIQPLPEVQIVMHMDGWGGAAKKRNTYHHFIYKEPVQFTGFKLFYRHDVAEPGTVLMTPEDLLRLRPRPIYVQYQ